MHIEGSKGKPGMEKVYKKPPKFKKQSKGKEKGKKMSTIKKEVEKPTCPHCSKKGHVEDKCWKLHPKLLLNKFQDKEKQNIVAIMQQ